MVKGLSESGLGRLASRSGREHEQQRHVDPVAAQALHERSACPCAGSVRSGASGFSRPPRTSSPHRSRHRIFSAAAGIFGRSCSSATYGLGGGVVVRLVLRRAHRAPRSSSRREQESTAAIPFHSLPPPTNLQPKTPNQPQPEPLHSHSHTNTLTMLRFGSKWAYVAPDAASKEIEVEYGT